MSDIVIRPAVQADLDAIKLLADVHKHELGFVLRPAIAKSIVQGEVFVAEIGEDLVGFVEYHHRRDNQTTLYHIAVRSDHRKQGIGRRLVDTLVQQAVGKDKDVIQLKCPIDLEANRFYEKMGFICSEIQPSKQRELAVWRLLPKSSSR
jgi:GNAT superfamily N-acetyltransferase